MQIFLPLRSLLRLTTPFLFSGFLLALFMTSGIFPAFAGGPIKTNVNGLPFHWDGTVEYHPDQGALKSGVYDENETLGLIAEAFDKWTGIPGINLEIVQGDFLPDGGNTDAFNFHKFFNTGALNCYDSDSGTPCHSPIIFDEDGEIIESVFGACAKNTILGFAGFQDISGGGDDPALTVIRKGQAIFNGACIEPVADNGGCGPCATVLDDDAVRTMILHELGHMLGLDHAQVNPDSYLECQGSGGCQGELAEHIPTMFPFLLPGAKQRTLHRDDEATLQRLYGNPENDYCTVSGNVLANDGVTPLRGVEVVARNTQGGLENIDAISVLSGTEAPRHTSSGKTQDNCIEDCGKFELSGLAPGETYRLCVQKILPSLTQSSPVNPVDPPFQGVDNKCFDELTVTCECTGSGPCPRYDGFDIITTSTGVDASGSVFPGGSAGGCQLGTLPRGNNDFWMGLMAFVGIIFIRRLLGTSSEG